MDIMPSLQNSKEKVLRDMEELFQIIRSHLPSHVRSAREGLAVMRQIRRDVYENLNQIQHEFLLVEGREWLEKCGLASRNAAWYWNPRQTGVSDEPDLRACVDEQVTLSAEATTSEEPKGVIDKRMRYTLESLSRMDGSLYYFVRTPKMGQRARTKCRKAGWDITVKEMSE
jgi:hypothetical protein